MYQRFLRAVEYLENQLPALQNQLAPKTILSIQRALLVCGLLIKHFPFEKHQAAFQDGILDANSTSVQKSLSGKYKSVDIVSRVFDLLINYALPPPESLRMVDLQKAGVEAVGKIFDRLIQDIFHAEFSF